MTAKATKAAARYGKGMKTAHCGICEHFRPPHGCTRVQGEVSSGGWCRFFERKGKSK